MRKATARDRAHRGAQFLDRERSDWYWHIDPIRLDLRSPTNCILGQVYGDFLAGSIVLVLYTGEAGGEDWLIDHGFQALFSQGKLVRAWREEINQRRIRFVDDLEVGATVPTPVC